MNTFQDDEIIESVLEGRIQNFEILIHRYNKKILNFIYRMIYDYDEAQSIAQDVFIKVYEILKNYKKQDNFQAFIFTIAKNLTLNYIKKRKRTLLLSGLSSKKDEQKYFFYEATQEKLIQDQQEEQQLILSIKELKENQRLALIMKVYMELSYKQISDITGWSVSKIETLISRAKGNLKKNIFARKESEKC
jgi:RNA polymerase sigma-70 factor (ECF subfamily)